MTETQSPPNPPVDSLFGLLDDPYRRAAIACLAERRAPVGLHALAEQIVKSMGPATTDRAPVDAETVATALHHDHLPRLADHGLLEYDVERRTVHVPRDEISVRAYMELAEFAERDWVARRRHAVDLIDRLRRRLA